MGDINENTLPEGWREVCLGDVCEQVSDKINSNVIKLDNYISTENMLPDKMGIKKASSLPCKGRYINFKEGDVLFSNIRTYFKKIWLAKFEGGASNDIIVFRPKDLHTLNNSYLYYLIGHDTFIDYTVKSAKGTKMPRGDRSAINNFLISLPPINEQKKIANLLSSFDNKIELLEEQNKTLEEIAQTIFKEWFGKYQLGDELPEGWRIGKLEEVINICGGGTPSTKNSKYWNGEISWTSPKDLSKSKNIFLMVTEKKITKEGLSKISSGHLPIGTLLLSSRAPIGYLAFTNIKVAINQGYIALLPKQYFSNYFMYLWLNRNMKIIKNAANGSTFLEISKSVFRSIECIIPSYDILQEFESKIEPIFKKILRNTKEIQSLKSLRDSLLPKLMNGVIKL